MKTTEFEIHTLLIPGQLSVAVEAVDVREKAVALRALDNPDAAGVAWFPRAALALNEAHSYRGKACNAIAYDVKPWFIARGGLDRPKRRALGLIA